MVLALGRAACSGGDDSDTDREASSVAEVGHIHGLGIDPADGRPYDQVALRRGGLPCPRPRSRPDDPGVVLATTEAGVAKSTDGAKTFADGAKPVLYFVSRGAANALYGLSEDGGKTFAKRLAVESSGGH
ncbi:hypothetical protein Sipo7851_03305 [Streptomyces ipomoeae]|nr:hypothetical protein Sipo7851_03305 [Streptomyces ipomoeae]